MAKDNPFSDNPFTQNGGTGGRAAPPAATGGAWGAPAASSGSVPAYTAAVPAVKSSGGSSLGMKGKESDLAKREADVAAREAELKRWEADLRSSGRLEAKKNWPRFCPITNMDIKGEVPEGLQNVVTCAYWSYLLLVICLVFQLISVIVAVILLHPSGGRLSGFFLALIYCLIGIPVAWILWYYRLYNAAKKDAAFTYAWFFLAYMVHIIWCIWSAISPPILFNRWSYAGWLTAIITALPENSIVGIFYIVGASLWTLEAALSIWVVQLVYRKFRGGNVDARLKNEAMQAAVSHAASRV